MTPTTAARTHPDRPAARPGTTTSASVLDDEAVAAELTADHRQLEAVLQRLERAPVDPQRRAELAGWMARLLEPHLEAELAMGLAGDEAAHLLAMLTTPEARTGWSGREDELARVLATVRAHVGPVHMPVHATGVPIQEVRP